MTRPKAMRDRNWNAIAAHHAPCTKSEPGPYVRSWLRRLLGYVADIYLTARTRA